GLAMSSRNARLTAADRDLALTLYHTLVAARAAYADGARAAEALAAQLRRSWPDRIALDYLEFRDPQRLDPVESLEPDTRLFLGAWLKGVRLIDNGVLGDSGDQVQPLPTRA